ncbi:hypothetical protein [Citrobacter amalonaticus]|nr:hypothetical protein [Citrobacter amalonaticus]
MMKLFRCYSGRKRVALAGGVLWLLSGIPSAYANPDSHPPEVDCQHLESTTDILICDNRWLRERNAQLNTLYELLRISLPCEKRGKLDKKEKAWKQEMESCGTDTLCLAGEYTGQVSELREQYQIRILKLTENN